MVTFSVYLDRLFFFCFFFLFLFFVMVFHANCSWAEAQYFLDDCFCAQQKRTSVWAFTSDTSLSCPLKTLWILCYTRSEPQRPLIRLWGCCSSWRRLVKKYLYRDLAFTFYDNYNVDKIYRFLFVGLHFLIDNFIMCNSTLKDGNLRFYLIVHAQTSNSHSGTYSSTFLTWHNWFAGITDNNL